MKFKNIVSFTFLLFFLAVLSGCSDAANHAEEPEPMALCILIGNHQNSRILNLVSPMIVENVSKTIENYGFISVVNIDSSPSVVLADSFDIPNQYKNADPNKLKSDAKNKAMNLLKLLSEVQADDPEVDTLQALRLGVRSLASAPKDSVKKMIIVDTGISTSGLIDFRNNLIYADPNEIAQELGIKDAIPDLNGITVIWQQLGDVSAPQQELSASQRIALENIWKAVIEKGGGVFENSMIIPKNGVMNRALPNVSVIDLPKEEPVKFDNALDFKNPVIFSEDQIKFIGNSKEFLEPTKAMETLIPVKDYILKHPDTELLIIGTTAGDTDTEFTKELSLSRAGAVKDILIELGLPDENLSVIGLGTTDPWHYKNVPLSSPLSAKNRKVVILDAKSKAAKEILQNNEQ